MTDISVITDIDRLKARQWNRLVGADEPFLRHEFLSALERHGCVSETTGWYPNHLLATDGNGDLLGAVPLYLKDNSYGEFVFDWGWAEAWHRHGIPYYPKLVSAIPFTPVSGRRLLTAPGEAGSAVREQLAAGLVRHATDSNVSSLHCLFPFDNDLAVLRRQGMVRRTGCQFHWRNQGYRDFDAFLARLKAKKRRNISRERRQVREAGITLERLTGDQLSESQWAQVHALYCSTFERLGGHATLTLPFFMDIATGMGSQLLVVLARDGAGIVATAILLQGQHTLFGRHWGCSERYSGLHFEACYYQGIEHCIEHNLSLFEPGAQGEHKLSRGFLPVLTWSAHWIQNPGFRAAVTEFVDREDRAIRDHVAALAERSPYRTSYPRHAVGIIS